MDDPSDTSWKQENGMNDFVRGIPLVGGIAGGMGMKTSAENNKMRAMERALRLLQQYRPETLQTRQNTLDNAMKLFAPVNRKLVELYGSGAAMPIAEATKSPFPDEAMASMRATSPEAPKGFAGLLGYAIKNRRR